MRKNLKFIKQNAQRVSSGESARCTHTAFGHYFSPFRPDGSQSVWFSSSYPRRALVFHPQFPLLMSSCFSRLSWVSNPCSDCADSSSTFASPQLSLPTQRMNTQHLLKFLPFRISLYARLASRQCAASRCMGKWDFLVNFGRSRKVDVFEGERFVFLG